MKIDISAKPGRKFVSYCFGEMKVIRWLGEVWDAVDFIIMHSFVRTLPFFGIVSIGLHDYLDRQPQQPKWLWDIADTFYIITTVIVLFVIKAYIQEFIHKQRDKRQQDD